MCTLYQMGALAEAEALGSLCRNPEDSDRTEAKENLECKLTLV